MKIKEKIKKISLVKVALQSSKRILTTTPFFFSLLSATTATNAQPNSLATENIKVKDYVVDPQLQAITPSNEEVSEADPTKPVNFIDKEPRLANKNIDLDNQNPIFKLSTIFYGKSTRVAIVNGDLLKEGDLIGDKEVVKINKQSVVLKAKNNSEPAIELFIANKDIKQVYSAEANF